MSSLPTPSTPLRAARLSLANLPTPVEPHPAILDALGLGDRGIALWIKRDDATGGPEAGNKIRKLEFLLAEAKALGATTLVTCGGIQSNHCRATAGLAARLGLGAHLLLRTTDPELDVAKVPPTGNLFLSRLLGASVRLITPADYRRRNDLMRELADALVQRGERPYVIPEGGSNAVGSFGYVAAAEELATQIGAGAAGGAPFDVFVHACGSGGTAAGLAVGARRSAVATRVIAMAVCDDRATFEARVEAIVGEMKAKEPGLERIDAFEVDDRAKGPAYAVPTDEQRALVVQVARASGIVLDPVYTGKAFAGLVARAKRGELDGQRVLFWHTGGLPGLLAQSTELTPFL